MPAVGWVGQQTKGQGRGVSPPHRWDPDPALPKLTSRQRCPQGLGTGKREEHPPLPSDLLPDSSQAEPG